MKIKYKRRYVLCEGYPWAVGLHNPYYEIRMHKNPIGSEQLPLVWPGELWDAKVPRYRLVLELVK